MNHRTENLRITIEERRGRAFTAAEKNIDIAGLQDDLEQGKADLHDAIKAAQGKAIRLWISNGRRGGINVKSSPAMEAALKRMYEAGERHGHAELARAGYKTYARSRTALRLQALLTKLQGKLQTFSTKLSGKAATLDLGDLSRIKIADALSKIPGALDVASRMVSTATYQGLGAAFDQAKGQVDSDQPIGGGGNGWEYTAVMDGGTCDPCSEAEGTTYATWDDAQTDLPDGGPNPNCDGEDRCRCRLAPVPL